jgi:endonuclease/exonuclease/phosphatase family metal-dependent hydrolase
LNHMKFENDDTKPILEKQGSLRIMTYNVHGFRDQMHGKKYIEIIDTIGAIDPDVLVIEGVFVYKPNEACTADELASVLKRFRLRYSGFSTTGINAVFSKQPFTAVELDLQRDPVKRLPRNALVCRFKKQNLVVVGTHFDVFDESGSHRKKQIAMILDHLKEKHSDERCIVTGDFNSLKRSDYTDEEWKNIEELDRARRVTTGTDAVPLIEKEDFVDSFDSCNESIKVSVWSGRRVDYIFGKNIEFVQSSEYRTTYSDHYPIYADIV